MWVGGVGARLAFAVAAGNGVGPAIARFSIAHPITGSSAWVAALVMMALADVLTQMVVIYLRGRRLAEGPGGCGPRPGRRPCLTWNLGPPRSTLCPCRHGWSRRAVRGQQGGAGAVSAVNARGHGRFRIGAPGAGDDLPFCGQHKTSTTPGSGKDQHANNTDKTVLPGTRRHAC
jgi:hypothetical protein